MEDPLRAPPSPVANIPASVLAKARLPNASKLHMRRGHPIENMKRRVYAYFDAALGRQQKKLAKFDDLSPVVSTRENFDDLLLPPDHPARSPSDTYYVCEGRVLRTHTTAHQSRLLREGHRNFLVTGDVYRRDAVDRTHYPVFHQMEGVAEVPEGSEPEAFLKDLMQGLVQHLFPGCSSRLGDDSFPFTDPSFEVEVRLPKREGEGEGESDDDCWMEVLGCGVVHRDILRKVPPNKPLVAWGIGLERLCMILHGIPDIRLFWTEDDRFLSQFRGPRGADATFVPYSHLQSTTRDISFWLPDGGGPMSTTTGTRLCWRGHDDLSELARELSDHDAVQEVVLIDEFVHPRTGRMSRAYRVTIAPSAEMKNPGELAEYANRFMQRLSEEARDRLGVAPR